MRTAKRGSGRVVPLEDLAILLDDRPGALAAMGEALGSAAVSIEVGGAWVVDGRGIAQVLSRARPHSEIIRRACVSEKNGSCGHLILMSRGFLRLPPVGTLAPIR
jgi:hypothetical protein